MDGWMDAQMLTNNIDLLLSAVPLRISTVNLDLMIVTNTAIVNINS